MIIQVITDFLRTTQKNNQRHNRLLPRIQRHIASHPISINNQIKTKTMKLLRSFLAILLLTATLTSCKKDNEGVMPAFNAEGLWSGKLSEGQAPPTGFFVMELKPGGVLERSNSTGNRTATGTWQLSGNNFSGNYVFQSTGTTVTLTGTLSKGAKRIEGTWSNNGGETGLFHATQTE
jgi:hypothetical protein